MAELGVVLSFLVTAVVIHNAYALQVIGNQQIYQNLTLGKPELISIVLYNDANATYTSTVNLTGNVTQIAKLLNTSITLDSFDLGTIYLNVTANEEGVWTGKVELTGKTIPVKFSARKFHETKWFSEGDIIEIQPGDYRIKIANVTENKAYIVTTQHGYVLQGKLYQIGEGFSTSDFSFKIKDIYEKIVKLEITSDYLNTKISVTKGEKKKEIPGMGFSFYTTQYANTIEAGAKIKEHFILRNGLSVPVTLKKIEYSGTVITDNGRQPINAVQYELGVMQPGEEKTFVIEINTKGLSPGVWTPIMTVKGLTQDNKIVSASISFVLTVTKAVKSPAPQNLTIDYPKEVVANKPFNITINGLSSGMSVDMETNPHLIGINVMQEKNKWIWTGKIDENKTQEVTIYVKLLGGIFKTFKFNLTVPKPPKPPEPVEIISPQLVWTGDKFTVKTNPEGADIDINGTHYTSPADITLLLPGTYIIKASKKGYKESETTIKVIPPVQANVSGNEVNKKVAISFSEEGTYIVKYNNKTVKSVTGKTLSFVPSKEGIYYVYDSLGHEITSFEIKKQGFSFSLPKINSDYLIIGLIILIIIIFLFKRKKKGYRRIRGYAGAGRGIETPLTVEEG